MGGGGGRSDPGRGAYTPFPWLEAMLGSDVQIGNEAIWAQEGGFDYADVKKLDFSEDNPWRRKYLEFVALLNNHFGDRCPVGQPILRGVSDMIAALRGASQMVLDLYDGPEEFRRLAGRCTDLSSGLWRISKASRDHLRGGTRWSSSALWAPDRVIRMQEDGSAFFSPGLYVKHLQKEDERRPPFPLQRDPSPFLVPFPAPSFWRSIRLKCIQINKDVGGSEIAEMVPFFKRVQDRGKSLLIRGKLDHEDLGLLRKRALTDGLYLQIVVESPDETKRFREFFQPWEPARP